MTITPDGAGGYTLTGTPTAWTAWTQPITLTPGSYLMLPNETGTGATAAVYNGDPGTTQPTTGRFEVTETGEWTARIYTDQPGSTVDATLHPRLIRP
ncbi:hypothetical protein [Bifidobacterium platyrrhinorum]|uniref:Uncharacterized protein n=1 Tax=Bifidobacterium platyrrhinorum TaxID=2661628 RepID=A0A6L9SU21_9BIFI|nr:hypothetical protein [Bifidobacterium platyrrhinorum]NEG56116.1 hypothetical protein [Bifidobacterium platyrrhinorum]